MSRKSPPFSTVCTVVGARPQFVKAAVLAPALREEGVREVLVHTGQHYDDRMSRIFFDELGLTPPHVNLDVGSDTQARQTARMLERIEAFLCGPGEVCEAVVVFGDTNSTLAAALAAAKLGRPVVHVEAGLRSYNRGMPEEINRIATDRLSDVLACPSRSAVEILEAEGRTDGVWFTGDVMYDAVLRFAPRAALPDAVRRRLPTPGTPFHVLTAHRPATVDAAVDLRRLLDLIGRIAVPVVWPVHPRSAERLRAHGLRLPDGVIALEPVGYLTMLRLIADADHVLTDSGGLQKEAFWLETPCVTLRPETEWTETLDGGWNTVVDLDFRKALAALEQRPKRSPRPVYGDGRASVRIARLIAGRQVDEPVLDVEGESHAPEAAL